MNESAADGAESAADEIAPRLALLGALVEEGTVTAAARRMGIPQPTASRWLTALGTLLGTPVVSTAGRGVRLTPAGEHLAAAAVRALDVLRGGCRLALAEADPERGQVALAFLHTMGGVRVPELLRGFRARHPDVWFTLIQGAHRELCERVRDGTADLALTSPLPADDEQLSSAALAEQALVFVAPSGHRLADRHTVRVAELAREQFVGLKSGFGLRQTTDALCAEAGFTPTLAFSGEEVDTLRGMVAASLGVALLPASETAPVPGTVEIPLRPPARRAIGLVWPADRAVPPSVRLFRDYALGRGG